MKKRLLSILCVAALVLTACDKKPLYNNGSGHAVAVMILSKDNAANIENDLTQLQTLSNTKAEEAINIQTQITKAAQRGDLSAVRTLVDKLKIFVDGFNKDLDELPLQSSEVSALKDKMKETNEIGIQIAEEGVFSSSPDMDKITELQNKAIENQKIMLAEIQILQTKANSVK